MPQATALPQSVDMQIKLTSDHIDQWLTEDFLRFRWWLLIVIYIACAVAWWKLLDKRHLKKTLLFTALAYIAVLSINEYGQELILWDYPIDLIPMFPPFSSVNLLLLPPIYSLVYQRFTSPHTYFSAVLVVTAGFCFVIEPLLAWGGFFQLLNWQYWLSLPLYTVMALIIRLLTTALLKATARARGEEG